MQRRTPLALFQAGSLPAGSLTAAALLAMAGCLAGSPPPPSVPPPVPASAPATSRAQPSQQPLPQPPSSAPSPASVPGRLKIALVSSWLWIDGQYASPLAKLDYVGLFGRLRERREASAHGTGVSTLELEVDATSDGRVLQEVLGLVEDADYDRVLLVTSGGPFSFCTGSCSAENPKQASAEGRRVAVLLRREGIALWSGKSVAEDAAGGADPKLEKLLEIPRSASDAEFEAGVRGVCSKPGRCSSVDLYFEEDQPGREVMRWVKLFERAAGGAGTTPPVISLSSLPPPLPGEESSVFIMSKVGSGRLPPVVIRQIVRASYGSFRECYVRGLAMNPKLEGRITVAFVIQKDGSVDQITNGGSELPSDDVLSCVLHGFRALRFPAPRGGVVSVQYPILLVTR